MKRFILPLILALSFYFEGVFAQVFSAKAFHGERILAPHFLLAILIFMAIYYIRNNTLWYALLFGLLYDVFFTEIIGINLFLFPAAVYLTTKVMKVLQSNVFIAILVALLNMAAVEFIVYQFYRLIGHVQMTMVDFVDIRLWPTLILNLAFLIIVAFPLKRWLMFWRKELLDD
ncbi:rod shape-determining protein MreD [Falsibacillus pallidus]|uniref:Rod shape-determining protein MreD n=1 Tax=Falsibacillus pallidus TaxID=493781 RepID=A0A370GKH2_9BACI|nr:rod shape-determining protein MreD [Falsibacillus pallidus]RDI44147.1 rod shape-determining protein MreD [Falsibacillus pallidus]